MLKPLLTPRELAALLGYRSANSVMARMADWPDLRAAAIELRPHRKHKRAVHWRFQTQVLLDRGVILRDQAPHIDCAQVIPGPGYRSA